MHAEKDGDWNIGVEEIVRAGQGEIRDSPRIRRHDRSHRHRRHAEQELARKRDEEQEKIHVRRIELRDGNILAPRDLTRPSEE